MAGVPVPAYQQFWTEKRSSQKIEYSKIIGANLDEAAPMQQLFKVLCEIEDLANYTPSSVGESEELAVIVSSAEEIHESYYNALSGTPLLSALYGIYTVTESNKTTVRNVIFCVHSLLH
jgi:hypothetical protein